MNAPIEHKRLAATLDDKYTLEEGWAFMTGTQALVRLPIQQRLRDLALGLNTAGYISGYRGSPLGQFDLALWQAEELLAKHDIVFRPGLNEELAATAVSGSQYVGLQAQRRVDGVFGIWYGKAPGVDRAVDALRHGNWAGTGPLGGVLALAGDDHGAKSSSIACYSDQVFESLGMPLLYPSSTQEVLDLGLHGIAMSRFSGLWTGFKCVTDVIEAGSPVYVGPDSPEIVLPEEFEAPEGGLSIRAYELNLLPQEERIYHHRIYAALAYARANKLNRIVHPTPDARIGIVAAGKAFQDVEQALARLGLDDAAIREQGIRVLRVGMTWPLDPEIVAEFSQGLRTIIVVEEKRPLLENQLRSILYGVTDAPRLIGKLADRHLFSAGPRDFVFPNFGELDPTMVMKALVDALAQIDPASRLHERLPAAACAPTIAGAARTPSFCSGCPHNRSTKLPEGSRGLAGIGCHGMAVMLDPANYQSISQMGGEGMHWLGQQPFTAEKHVFANLGDGTYAHSGLLAVRQAIAAKVPITYKILYNGFVSMTGGQPVESDQSVEQIVHSLHAEGVRKLAVVTDDPAKYAGVSLPSGIQVHPRGHLEVVQREFRAWPDVSVIVYDQPCATERRRLRKKGEWADPDVRPFINSAVCEGCGDCGKVSTCLSIEPLDTEFGRKRRINHSSCNKDLTCVEGFCPSFVTVHGGKPRRGARVKGNDPRFAQLPEPPLPSAAEAFNILVCGIGGTGVVTIGKVLAMAAHLDGLHCTSLDVMGMAQKYGAVLSHVRIATAPEQLHATRIGFGETDALIGCDLIVATGDEALRTLGPERTRAVVCSDLITTAEFPRNPDWQIDAQGLQARLRSVVGNGAATFLEGQRLATSLLGDAIAANMFMVGMAWQKGMIPLSLAAIERAIELNGVAVALNREAFDWGRRAAHAPDAVEESAFAGAQATEGAGAKSAATDAIPRTLDELIEHRCRNLVDYGGESHAKRYLQFVDRVREAERRLGKGDALSTAVATQYYRLLAVKDEWEVARLYARPEFREQLQQNFEGDYKLSFHLGAWPFAKRDPVTGRMGKAKVGGWVMGAFGVMSKLRFVRGSIVDPFRNGAERRLDRHWREQYERDLGALLADLNEANYGKAVELAALPERIRGFGHVREAFAATAQVERDRLMANA